MEIRTGARRRHILLYFYIWFGLIVIAAILNAINIDWNRAHPFQAIMVVVVLTMLQASAMEFLMITVVSLLYAGIGGRRTIHIPRKYDHNLTLLINFNLLARCEEDIESAYKQMYESFMSNLSPDISAVLLSVTGKENLRHYEFVVRDNYRALIRKTLIEEGECLLRNQPQFVNPFRLRYFWKHYEDFPEDEVREKLIDIVNQVAMEFMCIHRVSKVLKKCGQYQDLFLLSEGETNAYTYTDVALYSTMARPFDEPLFFEGPDVTNIHYRQFDYCLIMDNDTCCPPGTAQELLAVAAAHPDRGIIQPSIKMNVKETDTIYMHLEMWRQRLNEPLTRSMATLYGQWGFYGKGMINIRLYIKNMIGTRDRPLEIVPIDVLSHDTYEAAVLRPLYIDSLCLEEEPSYNYVTWHIRERRWNQGELILSRYFWPNVFGRPIGFMQRLFNKRHYIRTAIRTKVDFGLVSTHVAHSALRSMMMKPMMLMYIFLQIGVPMHSPFLPLAGVLFLVCIVPKFAITNFGNARFALLETFASILQYTPEAFIGSVRLSQAIFATICKSCTENWTPQRVVEEDMRHSNPFTSSIRHLWAYSVVAMLSTIITAVASPEANLIYFLFFSVIIIPIFTGFTSLNPQIKIIRTLDSSVERKPKGPPESTMEEGGPPVQQQWSNLLNDPPPGPRYTSCDPELQAQTFMEYETEDAPMRRPQRTEGYLGSQAPSLDDSDQRSNNLTPRQIALDEASQRVDNISDDSSLGRIGSSDYVNALSAVKRTHQTDIEEAGPSGLTIERGSPNSPSEYSEDSEEETKSGTSVPDQPIVERQNLQDLSPLDLVRDYLKDDLDADDEDEDTVPGHIKESLAEPPAPEPFSGKGKGFGKGLVLRMRKMDYPEPEPSIPTLEEEPEPFIPTLKQVMGKKSKSKDKPKSRGPSAESNKGKWKRIWRGKSDTDEERQAPVIGPAQIHPARAAEADLDMRDVAGGRGNWKKLPKEKIWDSDEPWEPPANWRQPWLKLRAPQYNNKPRPSSVNSISPESVAISPANRLENLPQAWMSEAVSQTDSNSRRTIPVQPSLSPRNGYLQPSATPQPKTVSPQVWAVEEPWRPPPDWVGGGMVIKPAVKRNYAPFWAPVN